MPVIKTNIETHHTTENLFTLVSDISRYPEFVRWIKAMRVSKERVEAERTYRLAEAVVGFKGFSESFATNVVSDASEKTVHTKLVRGPFRRLENKWSFARLENGKRRVDFYLDYSFSNPVLAMVARSNTETAVQRIMESFITEADRRYGAPQQPVIPI